MAYINFVNLFCKPLKEMNFIQFLLLNVRFWCLQYIFHIKVFTVSSPQLTQKYWRFVRCGCCQKLLIISYSKYLIYKHLKRLLEDKWRYFNRGTVYMGAIIILQFRSRNRSYFFEKPPHTEARMIAWYPSIGSDIITVVMNKYYHRKHSNGATAITWNFHLYANYLYTEQKKK